MTYPGKGPIRRRPFGVLMKLLACFLTPPSEPDLHLSAHPALPLSVFLSLLSMAHFDVKCLKIFRHVCINWSLEPSDWSDMIYMQGSGCSWLPTPLTDVAISLQYKGSEVSHSRACLIAYPVHIG